MSDNVIKIGELLVRAGIVTGVDLSEAEKLAKHMNLQFGQVLIMSGCLSEHDLDCSLVAQQLIREELLTVDVACQALAVASQHQMPFEDALEALHVVPKYGTAAVELAELLADAAIIPGEMLEDALMTSLTANVSLGELLVNQNAISSSLIPVLNMMLADVGSGVVTSSDAINEIRKNHFTWRNSQDSMRAFPSPPAAVKPVESLPPAAPVFVSQELMHAYEHYEPQQTEQPPQYAAAEPVMAQVETVPQDVQAYSEPSKPHSINDVLSKFAQKNPHPEGGALPAPHEQQVASWNAFVQSQSFDPNDVEALVPPLSVASEPRLHGVDESKNPVEVVQGTFSKTFDGKVTETLEDSFEPFVPPDFEPAPDVIEELIEQEERVLNYEETAENYAEAEAEADTEHVNEQFSQIVELLIESNFFDREDIIVAITNALKEESKAVRLIDVLGLADGNALMAASICSKAVDKAELTPFEAVHVLSDIKGGAEIHEALEAVNLELAVTVSADLQAMFDDEIDETFYVGDVYRNIEIFDKDDFSYGPEKIFKKTPVPAEPPAPFIFTPPTPLHVEPAEQKSFKSAEPQPSIADTSDALVVESQIAPVVESSLAPAVQPPVVPVVDDTPTIAFGYGRERLKIAKRREPAQSAISAEHPAIGPAKTSAEATAPQMTAEHREQNTNTPIKEAASSALTADVKRERVSTRDVLAKAKKAQEAVAEARKAQEAKRAQEASLPAPPLESHVSLDASGSTLQSATAGSENAVEPSLSEDESKTIRKRNSTTFNSLQALYVAPADSSAADEPAIPVTEALHVEPLVGNASFDSSLRSDAFETESVADAETPEFSSTVETTEEIPTSVDVENLVTTPSSDEHSPSAIAEVEVEAIDQAAAISESGKKGKIGSKAKIRGGAKAGASKKSKRRK